MKAQIRKRTTAKGVRYTAVVEVWSNGKRRIVSAGTHSTENEALRAGWALVSKYDTNSRKAAAVASNRTLASWMDEWVTTVLRPPAVKESTVRGYKWRVGPTGWIRPELGEILLSDLTTIRIKRWAAGLNLAPQTKRNALCTLSSCLNGAVEMGYLAENPCKGVEIKQSDAMRAEERTEKRAKFWTQEEAQKLIDASREPVRGKPDAYHLEALVLLGLNTGARIGELCALRWEDLAGLRGEIHIRRNLVHPQGEGGPIETSPKTGYSRKVKIAPGVVDRLLILRPEAAQDSDRIIPIHPHSARRMLANLCDRAGVPKLTPHSMRHTFATLLLSAGVPLPAVAKALGHRDSTVTLRTYAHALPDDEILVSTVLGGLLPTPTHNGPTPAVVSQQISA